MPAELRAQVTREYWGTCEECDVPAPNSLTTAKWYMERLLDLERETESELEAQQRVDEHNRRFHS